MTGVEILDQLHALGITAQVSGEKVRLQPGSKVPPGLLSGNIRSNCWHSWLGQQTRNLSGRHRMLQNCYPGGGNKAVRRCRCLRE